MKLTYIDIKNKEAIVKFIKANLSEKRQKHIKGVIVEAEKLAVKWHVDKEKAYLAALCHDMVRRSDTTNNLVHGYDAALLMKNQFGITDQEILEAVEFHTTGRENMTLLDKIIYLADAIEPSRNYPQVEHLRELAYVDLDKACLQAFTNTIKYIEKNQLYLDKRTLFATNGIKRDIEKREENK